MSDVRKAALVLAVITSLLLAACAGGPGSAGAAYSGEEQWKTLEYEGVSISYPPEWEKPPFEVPGGKMLSAPGNTAYIHMRLAAGEGPNIDGTDEETLKRQYEDSLSYQNPLVEAFEKKKIGGEEALTAVLTVKQDNLSSNPPTELIYHALVRRGGNAVTVLCTCKEPVRAEFEEVFKRVIDSIAVK